MTPDEFQTHVVDSLARLDVKMTNLVGNGQPGRVTLIEQDIEELKKVRWSFGGVLVGVSTVVSLALRFLFK